MQYHQNTLKKSRARSKSLKREFNYITLQVDGIEVALESFNMLEGVDFHYDFGGIILDKRFEFSICWSIGDKINFQLLSGEVGFWYDGASIPKAFQKHIGKPLNPKFLLPSLGHDIACTANLEHWIESMVLYKLLHLQKGRMDLPTWKEQLMFRAVWVWSLVSN
jgi:hypothetical protein